MPGKLFLTAVFLSVMLPLTNPDSASNIPASEKMKPEELVAKHLEAIGTAAARAAAKNRVMTGTAEVNFRLGSRGQLIGKSTILSEGSKLRLGMNFASDQYPGEQIVFDGNSVTVAELRPGIRSNLSAFLYQNEFLLKEGLIGGSTSTAWFLLDIAGRRPQPKLEYGGLKNIDGKKLHELKYQGGKGAASFQISFYFDPETFQHVLSLYSLKVPQAFTGTAKGISGDQVEPSIRMREEFSAFKTVDGLTLPHSYKLVFTIEGQNNTFLADWVINISQVLHNQQLDAGAFTLR